MIHLLHSFPKDKLAARTKVMLTTPYKSKLPCTENENDLVYLSEYSASLCGLQFASEQNVSVFVPK